MKDDASVALEIDGSGGAGDGGHYEVSVWRVYTSPRKGACYQDQKRTG